MWIEIRDRERLEPELLRSIERRLRFVLGRFGSRVQRVTVCLAELDGNAAQGEAGKRCTIAVKLAPHGTVHVEDTDTDCQTVVDRVTGSVSRLVQRELERLRTEPLANPAAANEKP
jgi:hypothetical protein